MAGVSYSTPKKGFARRLKQPTPEDVLARIMELVRVKFYPGQNVAFAKDKRRLLAWAILWPAKWLNERAVTVTAERYAEVLCSIIIDAAAHGNLDEITYLPAWLAKVIQSHFAMHGDELYQEAKNIRNLVENAMALTGRKEAPESDAVRDLARAHKLVSLKGSKTALKPQPKDQLTLL